MLLNSQTQTPFEPVEAPSEGILMFLSNAAFQQVMDPFINDGRKFDAEITLLVVGDKNESWLFPVVVFGFAMRAIMVGLWGGALLNSKFLLWAGVKHPMDKHIVCIGTIGLCLFLL